MSNEQISVSTPLSAHIERLASTISPEHHLEKTISEPPLAESLGAKSELRIQDVLTRTSPSVSVLPRIVGAGDLLTVVPSEGPRYSQKSLLGEGAMGEVLLAEDRDIGRKVALKRLKPKKQEDSISYIRFVDEVRVVGSLEHPNIVPIHDVGIDEQGRLFLVMKYVDGQTLSSILEKLRKGDPETLRIFDLERRVEIFLGLLQALKYAHEKGVIHRDIKPANIMIGTHGEVILMDWGVARVLAVNHDGQRPENLESTEEFRTKVTEDGYLIGTPLYMSPEQASGRTEEIDTRSDLFAAATVFHELLTLRHRFTGVKRLQQLLLTLQLTDAPAAMKIFEGAVQKNIPMEYAHFLHKALQLKPENRWQSAEAMIHELQSMRRGEIRVQCPVTFYKRGLRDFLRLVDRAPMTMVTLSVALVCLLSTACLFFLQKVL